MECHYCKSKFSSKANLNTHQKTAKYCLKLRGTVQALFQCKLCDKTFNKKFNLTRHTDKCVSIESFNALQIKVELLDKQKYMYQCENKQQQIRIEELQRQNQELQKQIHEIAIKAISRPTTSNKTQINNYIQNMQPVTDKHLIDNVQHLTIDHIKKGAEGYAAYALE